jgi:hypothetical protein
MRASDGRDARDCGMDWNRKMDGMGRIIGWTGCVGLSLALASASSYSRLRAEAPPGEVNLTATSANVAESGSPARIRILRWSTDDERSPVLAALAPQPPTATPAGAGPSPSAAPGAARGGRAGAGRGRRGGGARGDAGVPQGPIALLTAAISRSPTIGYIWTNDVTGYSIKYAYHIALPDGGERIVLATNRRLGAYTRAWTPVAGTPLTDYEFTLVEIRLDAKGLGEGKTSLTTKVVLDDIPNGARTIALDNYGATPAILQHVKR